MPIVRCFVGIGLNGCQIEEDINIDDNEWNALSKQEKEEYLEDLRSTHVDNFLDSGAYLL